jgi:LppP/LprE lipoprotein
VPRDRNPDATKPKHDARYGPPVVRTRPRHRIRPRSHTPRLALAGLGVAAGLVALASDQQPTQPADASATEESPSEIVRGVDFTTVAQPRAACTDVVGEEGSRLIAVERSVSRLLDEPTFAQLHVDGSTLYADLDGDGTDEAIVRATCTYGANGAQDTVQVWTVDRRLPRLVDAIGGAPAAVADDSRFPPGVEDVEVDGDELVVTYTTYADDDPNCCPTGQAVVTYGLDGGALGTVGRPVLEPLAR